jgi:hypothetical protein
MKKIEIQWKPVTNPPKESGYVLLAITHHDIPNVIMGFCKKHKEGPPVFKEDVYHGSGVAITHWAAMPTHPCAAKEEGDVS